ncbi:hypothetical protein BDF20DRAFT_909080 [Mycotypha africana]|uniref:uncharacterized protein n=1 Tax=Mycotypha africana TaxID=64632 RepID=UPI0023016252|nr:uncharacterized protein BDF20DRAFT_909080 [Mycotypha africana]KAI8991276.1 hypothetical protein BDF20DRAFT_909080 [Mycotypha africana]
MAANTSYQRLHPLPELKGSLLLKYRLAKALTLISLLAIISMAIYSIFNPNLNFVSDKEEDTTTTTTTTAGAVNNKAQPNILASQKDKCYLPNELKIRKSEDGTYTPPSPHYSLLRAVHFASNEEYQKYCQLYDTVLDTFSDVWPYNQNGECGNWQKQYIGLHKKNMKMLKNYQAGIFPDKKDAAMIENRPRFVSYICKEVPKDSNRGCGGLADRMGGMISTFFYALLTDRAYLLDWAPMNPLPLEAVWERPHIDWSHDPEEMESLFTINDGEEEENPYLGYQKVDTLNKKLKVLTSIMFPDGADTDFKDLWNGTYVEVRSNRGYIIRTFNQSPKYRKMLNEMGLTKENTFRCLTNFLFQPTTGSRRFLNAYKRLFEMESVLSIGIQIRTDDNALANPQNDLNTMEKWRHFFKCAGELAAYKKQSHHRHIVFFLVTDSHHLREEFVNLNENKEAIRDYFGEEVADISSLIITGLPIEHIEPDQIAKYIHVEDPKAVNLERMLPGVNSAYMENWLLGETQYRVISIQGYGKMASFYSGDDRTSISMPKPSLKNNLPACNTDDVFTTFDWLSTQWSLG